MVVPLSGRIPLQELLIDGSKFPLGYWVAHSSPDPDSFPDQATAAAMGSLSSAVYATVSA
jgi:hypothetical protein